jgi:hypothetical protein
MAGRTEGVCLVHTCACKHTQLTRLGDRLVLVWHAQRPGQAHRSCYNEEQTKSGEGAGCGPAGGPWRRKAGVRSLQGQTDVALRAPKRKAWGWGPWEKMRARLVQDCLRGCCTSCSRVRRTCLPDSSGGTWAQCDLNAQMQPWPPGYKKPSSGGTRNRTGILVTPCAVPQIKAKAVTKRCAAQGRLPEGAGP